MKYAWIAEQENAFALVEMCEVLDVSISGYRPGSEAVSRIASASPTARCGP